MFTFSFSCLSYCFIHKYQVVVVHINHLSFQTHAKRFVLTFNPLTVYSASDQILSAIRADSRETGAYDKFSPFIGGERFKIKRGLNREIME